MAGHNLTEISDRGAQLPSVGFAMTFDHSSYQLVLYDATTGKEVGKATVLSTHSLNVGDEIGGYRIIRMRPESTREVSRVDVVAISKNHDDDPGKR